MFVVIRPCQLRAGAQCPFELPYGADGGRIDPFRDDPGQLDTQLRRSQPPGHHPGIDHSSSAADHDGFLAAAQARYAQIDARGDTLTLAGRCVGRYGTPC